MLQHRAQKVPTKGKTNRWPSGLLKEQLRLHIRFKNNVSSPNIYPALLGNRLTSFCPLPSLLGVFSSYSRCVRAGPGSAPGQLLMLTNPTSPQGRDKTSCGSDPRPPRRAWSKGRGVGKQRMKMENGQRIPTSFRCSQFVFASAPLLLFPLLAFSTNATSEHKTARSAQSLRSPRPSPSWRGAIWSPATPGIPVLCRSRNDTAPRSPPCLACSCGGSLQRRRHLPCCDT